MMENLHHHILGIYATKEEAERTMSRLMELGLSGTQLNLIEPGEVPVGLPWQHINGVVSNVEIPRASLDRKRAFSDLMKEALLSGQTVLMGHTTTEEQTARAQSVINASLK